MRSEEPKWEEPLSLPPPPGMDAKTKGILFIAGGVVLALAAVTSSPIGLVFALPLIIYGGVTLQRALSDPARPGNVARTREVARQQYEQAHKTWSEAIQREEAEAKKRFEAAPRWYPIAPLQPTRRLDVFGGEVEGWASFMHTAFGTVAHTLPVTVLDLTGRDLVRRALFAETDGSGGLTHIAMPSQLRHYDPLLGTQYPGEIAALMVSSEGSNDDSARRDIEMAIFRRTADALGGNVTLPRLLAAVTSLLAPDLPLVSEELSPGERRTLLDPNFVGMLGGDSAAYLGRVSAALEAVVHGSQRDSESARGAAPLPLLPLEGHVIVALERARDVETRRRLDNLLVASLADRNGTSDPADRLLLVVGADRLARSNLEALADVAENRRTRLVIFFEHLRGDAREFLGRGAGDTILMSLGNHDDAMTAANFIGKEHRFVVSQITKTVGEQLGGSDTHGFGVSDSSSYTSQRMGPDSSTAGRALNTNFSYQTTWANTETYGESSTRSEEFVARAEDIQNIPTTGFIYITAPHGRKHVIFGDCHPQIGQSPLVSARAIDRR